MKANYNHNTFLEIGVYIRKELIKTLILPEDLLELEELEDNKEEYEYSLLVSSFDSDSDYLQDALERMFVVGKETYLEDICNIFDFITWIELDDELNLEYLDLILRENETGLYGIQPIGELKEELDSFNFYPLRKTTGHLKNEDDLIEAIGYEMFHDHDYFSSYLESLDKDSYDWIERNLDYFKVGNNLLSEGVVSYDEDTNIVFSRIEY